MTASDHQSPQQFFQDMPGVDRKVDSPLWPLVMAFDSKMVGGTVEDIPISVRAVHAECWGAGAHLAGRLGRNCVPPGVVDTKPPAGSRGRTAAGRVPPITPGHVRAGVPRRTPGIATRRDDHVTAMSSRAG